MWSSAVDGPRSATRGGRSPPHWARAGPTLPTRLRGAGPALPRRRGRRRGAGGGLRGGRLGRGHRPVLPTGRPCRGRGRRRGRRDDGHLGRARRLAGARGPLPARGLDGARPADAAGGGADRVAPLEVPGSEAWIDPEHGAAAGARQSPKIAIDAKRASFIGFDADDDSMSGGEGAPGSPSYSAGSEEGDRAAQGEPEQPAYMEDPAAAAAPDSPPGASPTKVPGRPEGAGEVVWAGKITAEDKAEFEAEACFVSGEPEVFRGIVPESLAVKGPVSLGAVEDFLISQLATSRTRAYSVAELRHRGGSVNLVKLAKISGRYNAIERSGRAEPRPGVEVYFIPPGPLAETLVEACLGSKPKAAGLTMVVVHRKKWRTSKAPDAPPAKRPREADEAAAAAAAGLSGGASLRAPPAGEPPYDAAMQLPTSPAPPPQYHPQEAAAYPHAAPAPHGYAPGPPAGAGYGNLTPQHPGYAPGAPVPPGYGPPAAREARPGGWDPGAPGYPQAPHPGTHGVPGSHYQPQPYAYPPHAHPPATHPQHAYPQHAQPQHAYPQHAPSSAPPRAYQEAPAHRAPPRAPPPRGPMGRGRGRTLPAWQTAQGLEEPARSGQALGQPPGEVRGGPPGETWGQPPAPSYRGGERYAPQEYAPQSHGRWDGDAPSHRGESPRRGRGRGHGGREMGRGARRPVEERLG